MVRWFCTQLPVWGVSTPTGNSQTLARCPTLQFSSELAFITWRDQQIPQAEGSVFQDCLPPHTSGATHKLRPPVLLTTTCYRLEVPTTCSFSLLNLLEPPTELREMFHFLEYQLIIKVHGLRNSQREEMPRVRHGDVVQSSHALSECATLPKSPHAHQLRSSPSSILLGVYGGFITSEWLIESLAIGD